jgi:hypothetical protein
MRPLMHSSLPSYSIRVSALVIEIHCGARRNRARRLIKTSRRRNNLRGCLVEKTSEYQYGKPSVPAPLWPYSYLVSTVTQTCP